MAPRALRALPWRALLLLAPLLGATGELPPAPHSNAPQPHRTIDKEDIHRQLADVPEWRSLWYSSYEDHQRLESALNNTVVNVTAQLGANAFLHCPVRNLGERGISWVRKRDWHILSSGLFMYTSDSRFQVLHREGTDDWTLQIKYVQKRDTGTYECQVSTASGILSRYVNLEIVVPEAFILGSGEHHVDASSAITLTCVIEKSPEPPQYVFWYHNERMINYDQARGVSVETEPGPKTQSRLTIRDAHHSDSGNYTCSASNTEPAYIYVFVSVSSNEMASTLRKKSGAGRAHACVFQLVHLTTLAALAAAPTLQSVN